MSTVVDTGMQIGKKIKEDGIKTSQIRKFLSAVNAVTNKIQNTDELNDDLKNEIQYLRVKLAYQAGREKVPEFLKTPEGISNFGLHYLQKILDNEIKNIKDKAGFNKFARLIETIVAYHKFYGGED